MPSTPSALAALAEPVVASQGNGHAPISRQAIVDAKRAVVGYAIFEPRRTAANDGAALFDALTDAGTETFAGKKLVFLRCTLAQMEQGHLGLLDPDKVVLEIPALQTPAPEDAPAQRAALTQARKLGFKLAFDTSVLLTDYVSWLPLASYLQVDLAELTPDTAEQLVRRAQAKCTAQIVVQSVTRADDYERMKRAGVKLFQGHWFAAPSLLQDQTVQASQASIVQLLNLVRREADLGAIEDLLKKDPALSFRLLRFINSCGFGLSVEITSFRHAVMILGFNKLFRWATLLMTMSRPNGAAPAAGTTAVVRGRLMELLAAEMMPPEECDNAFVTGVFSLLDTLLGMPLDKALASVNLPASVVSALMNNDGPFAPFLRLTRACESGDEVAFAEAAESLQLSNHQVNWAHLQALIWADELQQ